MSDKIYVGQKCATFRSMGEYPPVSRVTMWTDDEHYYTAGDDTGYEISVPCRSAKQEIVDAALKQLKGFVYRPFEATGVAIDPAYEPGDAVTINGIYSFIGQDTRHFNAMGLSDISCPGEREIDHEYPYKSPQERELKRRVKLGQNYFGTKITRKDGLVIENIDDKTNEVLATAVLNANILAFFKGQSREKEDAQLYFDTKEGMFKYRGTMNVNDKFIVDPSGNVVMKGGITLDGAIKWGTDNVPNKKRYAASTSGPWNPTMQSGDIYCCDWDYTAEKWGEAYKFKGTDGTNGSDASVNRSNVERALAYAKSLGSSFMAVDSVGSPIIYGGKIYGSEIYAGGVVGSGGVVGTGSVISLTDEGIELRNDANDTRLEIASALVPGVGTVTALYGGGALLIDSMQTMIGMYIGTPSAVGMQVGPTGTEFAGPVHFSGEVTGVTAVFA